MYSMNYIGKFIANFRDFYNEINSATLTGAIDVVVVEQPDGSFTCSPFHVRFGKLGVLRSRFKVVDLELNGEQLNIHMKLGESGEAFFVEEVGEDEAECSAHLATSPIPASRFDDLYEPRRRNSLSAVEPDHGQASDYTKRRYTADGQTMQKPNLSKLKPKDDQEKKDDNENEALFEMEGLDEVSVDWIDAKPKTFAATKLGEAQSEANQVVQKISANNDFRPIDAAPANQEEVKQNGNGKKKKKTRKVSTKKKHQRKSSTSSVSSQSDLASSEPRSSQPASIQNNADINFFSDTEANAAALSKGSRSGTPVQSDTEVELSRATSGDKSSQSWRWGELPEPPLRGACAESPESSASPASPASPASHAEPLSSDEERPGRRGVLSGMFRFMSTKDANEATTEGVYLDDLDRGQVDPDLYFPKHHTERYRSVVGGAPQTGGPTEEEYESGNGPSLPQSPTSLEPPAIDSDDDDKILSKGQVSVYLREGAVSRSLTFEEFCVRGDALLAEGRLEVRVGERRLPWRSAGLLILSLLAFRRPLPKRILEELEKAGGGGGGGEVEGGARAGGESAEAGAKPRSYSWWSWRRSNADAKRTEPSPAKEEIIKELTASQAADTKEVKVTINEDHVDSPAEEQDRDTDETNINDVIESIELTPTQDVAEVLPIAKQTHIKDDQREQSSSDSEQESHQKPSRRHSTFRKTLRLSSDQIKKLNLREGMNEMVFSVTTAYQGTTRCKCNVFRWRHDDKIVISDIDGTITKSDVLGHIFPLVGKDWAQSGVAQLFTKIKNNGYQLLYLSARAIGQARVTREYLRSIRQGEVCLPDGPLLLNPTSLLRAFHREVIEKKPEEFKIQCLADIKALFPHNSNPFYAGYGNRVNDVCAYQAVGIPIVRIFTINYKGELKHELTQTFQSTYSHMSVLVDQVFPPAQCEPSGEFSHAVYWRDPLPAVALPPPPAALAALAAPKH
ncbi:PREDICTED: phosphatidate phosphatase LPIN3 isoform X3 [Papilio polytes]|uniref:phosphatidate phosphatase LPIN3 isoform X3 n=1 Tax=Papilio polytes TaxID=76194 RepID=UPI000675BBFF|nr:PREDICTED: phosphatidate phosphatase LPIN3 isoform X3 [Papilio polytes]